MDTKNKIKKISSSSRRIMRKEKHMTLEKILIFFPHKNVYFLKKQLNVV